MKKWLAGITAALMLVSLVPSLGFAADDAALEQAILSAKSKIEVPAEYTEFESNIFTDELGNQEFHLTWSTKPEEYQDTKSMDITINSRGDVVSYSHNQWNDSEMAFANYTGDALLQIAKDWLSGVNPGWMAELPDEAAEYPMVGSVRSDTDRVTFHRQVNGLDFCGNQVNISINNRTGEVTAMYSDWIYAESVPDPSIAISAEDAANIFLKNSPMELFYRSYEENQAVLVYGPKDSSFAINAATGEEFAPFRYGYLNGSTASGGGGATAEEAAVANDKAALTEEELANIGEVAGLMSEADLRAKAESLENTGIDSAKFVSCNYRNLVSWEDDTKDSKYQAHLLYLENADQENEHRFEVVMDAMTGELLQYFSYDGSYDDDPAKITQAEADAYALAFAEAYAPETAGKIKIISENTEEEEEEPQTYDYSVALVRHENEIPYHQNYVSINVDKDTGRIKSFYKTWDKETVFEDPAGVLGEDRAGELLIEKVGMQLTYALAQNGTETIPAMALKYTLDPEKPTYIGAKTGDLLTYSGDIYDPSESTVVYPEDLNGHYAQEQINTLIESGILQLKEGETSFRPDEAITQKELLAFVAGLKTGYIPCNQDAGSIMQTARRYGIIDDPIDPEALATREDGLVFIIRALNYDNVAKLSGIFTTGFADEDQITPGRIGYVALSKGFGIVGGDENGCFNPQATLTRADAAIMIYNYLAN